MTSKFTPPQTSSSTLLSFPTPNILLVTLNRPSALNSIPSAQHWELETVFKWYDQHPDLRCAIITGTGARAFCAGQDLLELGKLQTKGDGEEKLDISSLRHPPGGFAGLSRRSGKKPVIAAVNGFALGGGFEIVLNCDMTVAAPNASFGLPEALRGIYAAAGGPARLVRTVGLPIATQIALTGHPLTAQEALNFGLVNIISQRPDTVVDEAISLARKVATLSPDAVIVTRAGLREAWETASVERATELVLQRYQERLMEGENVTEGLMAFAQKRKPNWVPSKL